MPEQKIKTVKTKTGVDITTCYCRKCMRLLPPDNFYDAVDKGMIDSSGKFSVCKDCVQKLYDEVYGKTNSMEKTIHELCIMLNVKYSNEAVESTRKHVQTLLESGKSVSAIFSIYKMKILSLNKSMDKSVAEYNGYEDVTTIFMEKQIDTSKIYIPEEVITFWGNDLPREDIMYLENEFKNFKQTHSADTYAEVVLLKEVCYTILKIKKLRQASDDTEDAVKELQTLMKSLAVSPNSTNMSNSGTKTPDSFGLWIQDIEKQEPAQWLKTDPRGDIYRDVANTEEYFQKYIVRPLKNFILGSKDFNIDDEESLNDDVFSEDTDKNFRFIDDGELDER